MNSVPDIETIDAWLPQTQCTQCGYPRCRDYAAALAHGAADINRCPPGGEVTIHALAKLLGIVAKPLNPENGEHKPRVLAVIREEACIGCTKCIQACPVDAILGAAKLMHTVISAECTGCELCLPPCPVDCIDLVPFSPGRHDNAWTWPEYSQEQVDRARQRTEARLHRLMHKLRREQSARQTVTEKRKTQIKQEIAAAVARVRSKKQQHESG